MSLCVYLYREVIFGLCCWKSCQLHGGKTTRLLPQSQNCVLILRHQHLLVWSSLCLAVPLGYRRAQPLWSGSPRYGLERRLLSLLRCISYFSTSGVSRSRANWVPVPLAPLTAGFASGERVVLSFGVFSFRHSFPFNHLCPKILPAGDGKRRASLAFAGGLAS